MKLNLGFSFFATLFLVFSLTACSPLERRGHPIDASVKQGTVDAAPTETRDMTANGDLSLYQGLDPDGGTCMAPQTAEICLNPISPTAGCLDREGCGPNGSGNGLDDNCNGQVDEDCPCTPGDVESCFVGPPGKHRIGACTDGTQTCELVGEFTRWGDCKGSIGPGAEVCDKLDNDCNGCPDDGLCCAASIMCPAPGDPRIIDVLPYTDVPLLGELFYPGKSNSWSWTVTGGPCDRLFASPAATPQPTMGDPTPQSFTLTDADQKDATIHFTLSGDYTVTLTVVGLDGKTYTCTWVQHVVGPGVRIELCWDHTGGTSNAGADIDLHTHRAVSKTDWFNSTDDCFYSNCKNGWGGGLPWGYAASPAGACNSAMGTCANPRLDIDNISDTAKPENINIDNPNDTDGFRVMVHYYGGTVDEHPIVNIYCGGVLKSTFGQAPNQLSGFNTGQGNSRGQLWRVADVQAQVDMLGTTTGCTVTAIHPPMMMTGYWVTPPGTTDMSY